jgi:predicted CXXCH cytochrome family protein
MTGSYWKYAIALLVPVLLIAAPGCSRKTLSLFFDGVPPDADTIQVRSANSISGQDQQLIAQNTVVAIETRTYYHVPYRQKDCAACHDQNAMGSFTVPQPDLCYTCHEDYTSKYTVLHVPVEMGMCTECHHPHMSTNKGLLKQDGQQLCFMCHDPAETLGKEQHEGIGDANCTECHNPHGGSDGSLLN